MGRHLMSAVRRRRRAGQQNRSAGVGGVGGAGGGAVRRQKLAQRLAALRRYAPTVLAFGAELFEEDGAHLDAASQ